MDEHSNDEIYALLEVVAGSVRALHDSVAARVLRAEHEALVARVTRLEALVAG